jgi:site-specific DNA recombinase
MADEQKRLTTAIYIRWSTDEQSDGTTLEVQREACLYFCKAKSWDVNDRYIFVDDGYSGGSLNRPAITELRQLVKSGLVQRVVVYKLDRLTRSVVDAVELVRKEWDGVCQVVSTQESFDTTSLVGRLLFDVLISFAEWERSTIRERTYSGKLKRAEQKRNPGMRFPFGYRKGSEGTFEIDKEEAVIVRRVFSDYLKGLGMLAIAQALNAEGIRTRRGFTWTNQRIRKMLTNPAYKGTLRYGATEALPLNRRRTEGKRFKLRERPLFEHEDVIPAIITVADWDRAQLVMQGRAEQHPKVLASQYLLSGLLKCGICGGPMSAYRNTGRSGKVYYYCVHQKQGWNKSCTQSNIPAELLEDAVCQLIKQDLSSEGVRRYVAGARASYEQRVNATSQFFNSRRVRLLCLQRTELSLVLL